MVELFLGDLHARRRSKNDDKRESEQPRRLQCGKTYKKKHETEMIENRRRT